MRDAWTGGDDDEFDDCVLHKEKDWISDQRLVPSGLVLDKGEEAKDRPAIDGSGTFCGSFRGGADVG